MIGFWVLGIIASAIFCIAGIAFAIFVDAGGLILTLMGIGGMILSVQSLRKQIAYDREQRKLLSDAALEALRLRRKKVWKRCAITFAIGFAILMFLFFPYILPEEKNPDACRNCGTTEDVIPGYGYCPVCYEGFVEWQERNP